MSYELVIEALRHAQEDYEYMFDHDNPFTGKVDDKVIVMKRDEDGKFRGDCDDFAVKFFNRAIEIGVPRERLAFALCLTSWGSLVDHIGVLYRSDDDVVFFIDCGYPNPIPPIETPYKNWYRVEWGAALNTNYSLFDPHTGAFKFS